MKRLLIILLLLNVVVAKSQQEETYTQYIFNQYALNPAYGGTNECADIKFGTRLQWVGFDGAPMTSFLTYHTALGFKDRTTKSWHGMGVYVVDDRHGTFKSTGIYPSYAFHLRLTNRLVASAGFFIGVRNFSSGIGGHSDPAIQLYNRMILPDLGIGGLVYNPEFFIGLSIKQVYTHSLRTTSGTGVVDNPFSYRARQYYFTAARWIEAPYLLFSYTPSIHIKYQESIMPSVDVSIMFHYAENRFNWGASYRIGDGIAAMLQFNLLKKLSVGYAYEYPLNKVRMGSRQTHEIIFKWDPCWSTNDHFGGVNCPAF